MTLASVWSFLQRIPGWVWLAIAGLMVGFAYVEREKARARREVNDQRDKEAAEVEAAVTRQITETTNEIVRQADSVRARDAVVELPDGTSRLPEYHYRD